MQPLRTLFTQYQQQHRALPSFNIDTFLVFQAIEAAVTETSLPCLVQLSKGEDSFVKAERLLMLVKKAQADGLPLYLNMDHSQDISRLKKLLLMGFDMVHFDGSALSFSENLSIAKDLIDFIHIHFPNPSTRPLLEVEFNKINLIKVGVKAESLTDPQQAEIFMRESQADLLAVSVGNLHGLPPDGQEEHINTDLFKKITSLLPPSTFYTMHGGSGISPPELSQSISLGVVKININTDLRHIYKVELKNQLNLQDTEKMYDYYLPVLEKLKQVAVDKLTTFAAPSYV